MDIYSEFKQEYYDSMLAVAAGKPIALAEVGGLPSPKFSPSSPVGPTHGLERVGRQVQLSGAPQVVYHAPQILGRDDPRLSAPWKPSAKPRPTAQPGHPAPSP